LEPQPFPLAPRSLSRPDQQYDGRYLQARPAELCALTQLSPVDAPDEGHHCQVALFVAALCCCRFATGNEPVAKGLPASARFPTLQISVHGHPRQYFCAQLAGARILLGFEGDLDN
jgi:hypothetical protein